MQHVREKLGLPVFETDVTAPVRPTLRAVYDRIDRARCSPRAQAKPFAGFNEVSPAQSISTPI
jgi:hypothetical protein